ncbi:hypothetical protein QYM36_007087, partial [Artemia franciscana]
KVYKIGRSPKMDIHCCTSTVASREHAHVKVDDGHLFVMDLEKTMNGTYINNRQISKGQWTRVEVGSLIWIGCQLQVSNIIEKEHFVFKVFFVKDVKTEVSTETTTDMEVEPVPLELPAVPEAGISTKTENISAVTDYERSILKKQFEAMHLPSFIDENQIEIADLSDLPGLRSLPKPVTYPQTSSVCHRNFVNKMVVDMSQPSTSGGYRRLLDKESEKQSYESSGVVSGHPTIQNKFTGVNPDETSLTSPCKTISVQSESLNSVDLNKVKLEYIPSIRPKPPNFDSSGYSQVDVIVIEDSDDEQSNCSKSDDGRSPLTMADDLDEGFRLKKEVLYDSDSNDDVTQWIEEISQQIASEDQNLVLNGNGENNMNIMLQNTILSNAKDDKSLLDNIRSSNDSAIEEITLDSDDSDSDDSDDTIEVAAATVAGPSSRLSEGPRGKFESVDQGFFPDLSQAILDEFEEEDRAEAQKANQDLETRYAQERASRTALVDDCQRRLGSCSESALPRPPAMEPPQKKLKRGTLKDILKKNCLPAGYCSALNQTNKKTESLSTSEANKEFKKPEPRGRKLEPLIKKTEQQKRPIAKAKSTEQQKRPTPKVKSTEQTRGMVLLETMMDPQNQRCAPTSKPKTKHVKFDPNLEKALRKPAIAEVLPMQRQAPQHLVSPILATLFSATGIREQILRWNRNWLREMDKINADKQPPPAAPIEFFPNGFVQIPLNFSDVNHYLSVFGPPLMLETLYRIKKEYDDLNNRQGKDHVCTFTNCTDGIGDTESNLCTLTLHTIKPEGLSVFNYLREGSLVVIRVPIKSYDEGNRKVKISYNAMFGYVNVVQFARLEETPGEINPVLVKQYIQGKTGNKAFVKVVIQCRKKTLIVPNPIDFESPVYIKVVASSIKSLIRLYPLALKISESPLRKMILQPKYCQPRNFRRVPLDEHFDSLNPAQKHALKSIISQCMENPNEPHICLLQGPPGTGKTRTTASLILQLLLLNPSYNILVCSPSNAGVDEIVQRTRKEMKDLKKSFKIVRYGVSNNVSCATQPLLLDNQVQKALTKDHLVSRQRREEISLAKIHIDRLKTAKRCTKRAEADLLILRKTHQDELDRIMENRSSDVNRLRRLFIKSAHIVATTLSSCSNDALDSLIEKTGKRFDFCVVDEACTCTEMEIMQPISYGMKNLILVGDHKQLQATVFSKVAASVGYHKSLFWRLAKVYGDDNILSLRTQYRMHPAISEFPSRRFYNNCLLNAPSTVRYAGVCPYILLDVIDSEEETKGVNIQNSAEALLASQLAILLAETNELPTIGVIAPYRMHKEGIIELLKK